MELQERLKVAQEAGPKYEELASIFEAAITEDVAKLSQYRTHPSAGVRFAAFINPLTEVSIIELDSDPLLKYAAIYNPSTSTQILDYIGLSKTSVNPIIPEAIHAHANASKEFQVFRAITDFGIMSEYYEEDSELYFFEAIYDSDADIRNSLDLTALEALLFSYLLGLIEAPDATGEFWLLDFKKIPANFSQLLEMFGRMPAISSNLYDVCGVVQRVRIVAAERSNVDSELEALAWDSETVCTGVGGFYWLDSLSPRAAVAWNRNSHSGLLQQIFNEEISNEERLKEYPASILWRLASNPSSPHDVLDGIIALIEQGRIVDEYAQLGLLVGEEDDWRVGLVTNPSVTGKLRARVEKLLRDRDLDPEDFKMYED
jgi:hypothetical protein